MPTSFGNDKDPEPVRIKIKAVSESDLRAIVAEQGMSDGKLVSSSLNGIIEEAARRCVLEVENYTDRQGRPIKTGEQLAKEGEGEILSELFVFLQEGGRLDGSKKKDSESSSDSTHPTTIVSNGTVPSVEGPISTLPGDAKVEVIQSKS